jgi:MFS transporter, ACS family, glucarate transporter
MPNQAERPSGATRVRYLVLALLCGLAVITYIQRLGFNMGLSAIKQDLRLSNEQAALLTSAFLFSYGLLQVPVGFFGDRHGGRSVLTVLVLGWSLLTGAVALIVYLPGLMLQFSALFLLRCLFGGFQAGGFPVMSRIVADWMPVNQRGSAMGTLWMFSRIGGAIVPPIFYGMLAYFGNWRTPFWAMAALGLIWCCVFWPWFRSRPEQMRRVNEAERELIAAGRTASASTDARGKEPIPWRQMLGSRNVWALSLMYGCVGFSGNFVTNLLPLYLEDHRHLSHNQTQTIASMVLGAGVLSCILGGVLSDAMIRYSGSRKWGRRFNGVFLILAGLAIVATIGVSDQSVWPLGLLFSGSFFLNDMNMGPAWAACADVGERYAGTIGGTMNMIGNFTGAASMTLMGHLLDRGQGNVGFILFGGSYVLAALCWLAIDVTQPLLRKPEPATALGAQ